MAENRRKYTREFKVQAVGILERGEKTGQQIEEDLGIGKGLIYRWRAQLAQEGSGCGFRKLWKVDSGNYDRLIRLP